MAKFYGDVGFATSAETSPGVWTDNITRIAYRGDILRESARISNEKNVSGDITPNNRISIIVDTYARRNLHRMRFVVLDGVCWSIKSVELRHPRLILTLGGPYNE